MAGKSKTAGAKKGAAPKKGVLNKSKKDKNIFKVSDAKSKKKPKEVQGKLKQVRSLSPKSHMNTFLVLFICICRLKRWLKTSRKKLTLNSKSYTRIWS